MLSVRARHHRFQRVNAWLLVFALLFQSGLAMACAGHDLLHAWGVDSHHSDHEHALAQQQDERSTGSEAGHDLFHGSHGSLHAPVLVTSSSIVIATSIPAAPPALQTAEPPSALPDRNLRPPITR